jgi:hypothetical protein
MKKIMCNNSHPFSPSCIIRKGYPLSPFLFIIMAEGLICYIKESIADRSLTGLPLHGLDPLASHNEFFNDTLMLGSLNVREALKILLILQTFCEASGMDINRYKYQIFFFNTLIPIQIHITNLLGFMCSSLPSKYLGIPLIKKSL